MNAYYYRIVEYNSLTCQKGNIVLEGIIRNSEDTIYPSQETGIEELSYECEAHHFKHQDYILEGWNIEISREYCVNQKRQYSTN